MPLPLGLPACPLTGVERNGLIPLSRMAKACGLILSFSASYPPPHIAYLASVTRAVVVVCKFLRTNNQSYPLRIITRQASDCYQHFSLRCSSRMWPESPNQRSWLKVKQWPQDLWRAGHRLPDSCQEPPARFSPHPFLQL